MTMKTIWFAAGEKLRQRISVLLAAVLLLTAFAVCPGLSIAAEAENGRSGKEWRDIVDVIAGEGYTVALREDGRVLYTGNDFSGVGRRIASWDGIERIEIDGWQNYLVGYRQDGSIRLEALLDQEKYGSTDLWSEKDLASWSGIEQVYTMSGICLGLTRDGRVLTVSRSPDEDALCRELSTWRGIRKLAFHFVILGLKQDGTVICTSAEDEYGQEIKAFWESPNAPKHIVDLISDVSGLYAIDDNGTVVFGLDNETWTNVERLYLASDSMFGLRRDGTVAVYLGYAMDDPRLQEVAAWHHIKDLGFEITGWARYVPVGLKEDGTVCAVTEGYMGEPYGAWDFTGWSDVQKLFSGTDCTIGLRSDGSLLVTGGEFGSMDCQDEIAGWTDIQDIFFAKGEFCDHVVGLKRDGTLVAAGDNSFGQCNVNG